MCAFYTVSHYICIPDNLHSQLPGNPGEIYTVSEYRLFQCDSGEFVSRFDVCDELKTCLDASDERNCSDEYKEGKPILDSLFEELQYIVTSNRNETWLFF